MNVTEYIQQRFQSFGITLSEADLFDICLSAKIHPGDEVMAENHASINVGIARFVPTLMLRAKSIGESGFSISWDTKAMKDYYSYMCKKYGLRDELSTDKPRVKFL